MLKLAIVDMLGEHGGMNYYTHGLATAMTQEGAQVEVMAPRDRMHEGTAYSHHVAYTGAYGKASKAIRSLRLGAGIISTALRLRATRTDWVIFHIFRADMIELTTLWLSRLAGCRVACIIHDVSRMDVIVTDDHMKRIVAASQQLIVHNEYSRDLLCRAIPEARSKIAVAPHGSYLGQFQQFDAPEARARLGVKPESKILLFFGKQRPEKGLDIILRALRPYRNRTDFMVLVAGKIKPHEERDIRAIVEEAGVAHLVRFDFGHITDEQLPIYYSAATAVLLPYRRVYESGVALMALSFGRPIITSDIPVFAALVHESGAGITARNDDPDDFSVALGKVLDDEIDLDALSRQGLLFATYERSWAQSGSKIVAALSACD